MIPEKLELLKKIQPLFTEWNVGDRVIDVENKRIGFIQSVFDDENYITVKFEKHFLRENVECKYLFHYPYPHQMIEKIGERFVDLKQSPITNGGFILTVFQQNIMVSYQGDLETALLKALLWQMEGL